MITVVGGSGFVGSRLISKLEKSVCDNIDKKSSKFFDSITTICDIRFFDKIFINKKTKTVILLAAEHRDDVKDISLYYSVNVDGTKNVLRKMDEVGIKNLIFTSSVAIYGLNKNSPNESSVSDPFNHYGKSKLQAEKAIINWFNKNPKDKSVTIIRPTVIFGERNRGNVYKLLRNIYNGRVFVIGNGKNKKSMAYVENVVDFICFITKSQEGLNIYNYADKPDLSMNELVSTTRKLTNQKNKIIHIPLFISLFIGYIFDSLSFLFNKKLLISSVRIKKFAASTTFDSSKSLSIFEPKFTLNEGLKKTLKYEFNNSSREHTLFHN